MENFLNNLSAEGGFYYIILSRLIASIFLASMLGIEREVTGKVAGLRTHILVCSGACVFTLLSIYGFKMAVTEGFIGVNDPARIGAQIITGIGFIGAGTIMRTGSNIHGITTAATLWMTAAIGMACGCGLFSIALFSTLLTLFVLILIRQFEHRFLSDFLKKYRNVKISICCPIANIETVNAAIDSNFKNITKIEKRIGTDSDFVIKLNVTTRKSLLTINHLFKNIGGINKIDIQEVCE